MTGAARSELRKLLATRSLWLVPAGGAAVLVLVAGVFASQAAPADIGDRLSDYGPLRFGAGNIGLLLMLFGIRLFGDETHHRTLASTYLATPRRSHVLAAKAATAVAVVLAFCAVVDVGVLGVTAVALGPRDLDMTLDIGATAGLIGRGAVAMSLLVLLGVAAGAAVRNRSVALVGLVVWFALGEEVAGGLLHIDRFLPGAVADELVAGGRAHGLGVVAASAALVAYVAVAASVARFALRRDVA
jgi:hypothetical protein